MMLAFVVEIAHVNGPRPSITGSALYEDVFTFHQVHFHWGSKNSIGSEHAVFDQKYPMEMHLVHFNDKYESWEKAMNQPDGLSVIAVFLQVSCLSIKKFLFTIQHEYPCSTGYEER